MYIFLFFIPRFSLVYKRIVSDFILRNKVKLYYLFIFFIVYIQIARDSYSFIRFILSFLYYSRTVVRRIIRVLFVKLSS